MTHQILDVPFDADAWDSGSDLFPLEISERPWVAYHGTTSTFAPAIEDHGFNVDHVIVPRPRLQELIAVFKRLEWRGWVRNPLSGLEWADDDGHISRDGAQRFVYFAESAPRAALYATRDFAGGELCRSIRNAFAELRSYLVDEKLREHHLDWFRLCEKDPAFTLAWLAQEITRLEEMAHAPQKLADRHAWGVVYAVRFAPADQHFLSYDQRNGVKAAARLPADRIVARVIVPPEAEWRAGGDSRRLECGVAPRGLWEMVGAGDRC